MKNFFHQIPGLGGPPTVATFSSRFARKWLVIRGEAILTMPGAEQKHRIVREAARFSMLGGRYEAAVY